MLIEKKSWKSALISTLVFAMMFVIIGLVGRLHQLQQERAKEAPILATYVDQKTTISISRKVDRDFDSLPTMFQYTCRLDVKSNTDQELSCSTFVVKGEE